MFECTFDQDTSHHTLKAIMRLSWFLLILVAAGAFWTEGVAWGQGTRPEPPVTYLAQTPAIDGKLDEGLLSLPVRQFPSVEFPEQEHMPSPCTYRLGYTAGGLYLYIEVGKAALAGRDRAYQNGDGFHMMLGIPAPGESLGTREFYVLAFSPMDSSRRGKFIWYRNVDLAFTPLRSTQMKVWPGPDRTGIEILLPWNEVYPYHPWLQKTLAFNLCFVEAAGEHDRVNHFVLSDRYLQSEQSPRLYRELTFAPPPPAAGPAAYLALVKNHMFPGDTLRAAAAGIGQGGKPYDVEVTVKGTDTAEVFNRRITMAVTKAGRRVGVDLGRLDAPPGRYVVSWSIDGGRNRGRCGLTILPSFSRDQAEKEIDGARNFLRPGSVTSLQFLTEWAASGLARLKPYDTGDEILGTLRELAAGLASSRQHQDYLQEGRGVARRAYRSTVDSSLQPYTVRVPAWYDPTRRYPLVVYLHGSGEDDRGHFNADTAADGYIRLAPSGRGTSNAYTTDHAQDDIREAIRDVRSEYSIDSTRIVLSGFSMGGYGVYRTFYENPRVYAGLAVFSGSPDIGRRWIGPEHPDFQDSTLLRSFRDIPIFIFHGGRDRNCPVEQTEELVRKLRAAGAVVEFHLEPEKGHESPGPGTVRAYRRWLKNIAEQ